MIITVDKIKKKRPCPYWLREQVESVIGEGVSHTEFAALETIPWADRVWGLLQFIPVMEAVRLAEHWAYKAKETAIVMEAAMEADANVVDEAVVRMNVWAKEWARSARSERLKKELAMTAMAWAARVAEIAVFSGGEITEQSVIADILAVYDKMEAETCTSQTIQA